MNLAGTGKRNCEDLNAAKWGPLQTQCETLCSHYSQCAEFEIKGNKCCLFKGDQPTNTFETDTSIKYYKQTCGSHQKMKRGICKSDASTFDWGRQTSKCFSGATCQNTDKNQPAMLFVRPGRSSPGCRDVTFTPKVPSSVASKRFGVVGYSSAEGDNSVPEICGSKACTLEICDGASRVLLVA